MSERLIKSPRRRRFLAGVGAGLVAYGAGVGATAADSHESVQVVLDNVGASAWELVAADEDVGEQGVDNPALTLQEGTRYTFVNQGSGPHPLAFRDEDGTDLLSQDSAGSYEDQEDVNYEEDGEEMALTLTEELAADLDTYICTVHPSMEGSIQTVDDDEGDDTTVTFPDQATASSTFTAEEATDPAVSVTVESDTDSAVVVTYEDNGDLVIAGLDVFDADELDGEDDLIIPVEDAGGFPGEHVAHAIPTDALSGEYGPGDTVSADTAEAVADNDAATVVQATLSLDDQTGDEPVDEGDVMASVDVSVADGGADLAYVVDVHPTDDDALVGDEFVGATDVLVGENPEADVIAERVPGDGAFNEFPFEGTDSFVAMIHVVDDGTPAGEPASPGSFPVLPNIDAEEGAVPGGVTDSGTVSVEHGVTVTLDNVGADAYEVTNIEGDDDVAPLGAENPTLTLREGVRYTIENGGWDAHPLEFFDAGGAPLLTQGGDGAFEEDDAVNWVDDGETVAFTLTQDLAAEISGYVCTVHPAMEGAIEVAGDVDAEVTFPDQATASSTFTAEEPTTPGVAVTVAADDDSAVVVTYEDGEDLVVAGLGVFDADELDGEDAVVIPVEDAGGFPGEHVAHAIPTDTLSGEYGPGDTVSADTAEAVADNDAATVVQADLSFADQSGDEPVDEGDVMASVDVSVADAGADLAYVVDVHPTDGDGELVGDEFVGATDVLSGENENAEIVAERVPSDGAFNELPFEGTDSFVAMIHVVDDDSAVGDAASPGSFPVLPNVDADAGPVPGGVTDLAEITAEPEADDVDDDVDVDDTDDEPPDVDDTADDADDDGPGFGPIAGVAGLGGLAAYAYRKLRLDSEPPTPEDDALGEQDT